MCDTFIHTSDHSTVNNLMSFYWKTTTACGWLIVYRLAHSSQESSVENSKSRHYWVLSACMFVDQSSLYDNQLSSHDGLFFLSAHWMATFSLILRHNIVPQILHVLRFAVFVGCVRHTSDVSFISFTSNFFLCLKTNTWFGHYFCCLLFCTRLDINGTSSGS